MKPLIFLFLIFIVSSCSSLQDNTNEDSTLGSDTPVEITPPTDITPDEGVVVPEKPPINEKPYACTQQYDPVCGKVPVQCVKAPCYPVEKTFGNACMAQLEDAIDIIPGVCGEEKYPTM